VDRIGKRQHVRGSEPANADEVVARYQASTRDDVETAIDAAVAAQDDWAGTPDRAAVRSSRRPESASMRGRTT